MFYDGWLKDDISWIINFHLEGRKNSNSLDLCAQTCYYFIVIRMLLDHRQFTG